MGRSTWPAWGSRGTSPTRASAPQARFQAANENNEVKGWKFDYKEFADDNNDPNTALAEARRLVTQEGVLAIVPAVSVVTPSDFLTQQQIPWFGSGYDVSYCTDGEKGFGLSVYGCLIPENPKRIAGVNWEAAQEGARHQGHRQADASRCSAPTRRRASRACRTRLRPPTGVGFEVVYAKGAFPGPPAVVGDYTPYAQELLASNDGQAPDVIYTSIAPTSALGLTGVINANGYTGTYLSPFYTPLLIGALKGAYVFTQFAGFEADSPAIKTGERRQIEAFKPGTKPSITLAAGYFSADMFIASVKASLKKSKTLTSASVQKAAAAMTYQIKDTIGPTKYPASFKVGTESCSTLYYDPDGTAFEIVQPFTCTTKTYPVLPKFANG